MKPAVNYMSAPKKVGRPRGPKPRGPFSNKRCQINTKITGDTRKALEDAADHAGRSLSQEIELRLVRSFRDDDIEAFMTRMFRSSILNGNAE